MSETKQNPNDYPLMPNKDGAPASTPTAPGAPAEYQPPPSNLPATFRADPAYQKQKGLPQNEDGS
jgi:hypothetical protein